MADLVEIRGTNVWYELADAELAAVLGLPKALSRRNDTLDVWIDSGVSHEAVLRGNPALHWPADVYIEATDQHRGWFQSSLMTSVAINGAAPYREVLTHAFVVDLDSRQKISKSQQGGYAKPTEILTTDVNKNTAQISSDCGFQASITQTRCRSARRCLTS